PEAIEAIYPATVVQTCIVHLIRHSLRYVPRREREQVARDLKPIYTAANVDAAQAALEAFDGKWGTRFPVITQAWLNAREYVTPSSPFRPSCVEWSIRRMRLSFMTERVSSTGWSGTAGGWAPGCADGWCAGGGLPVIHSAARGGPECRAEARGLNQVGGRQSPVGRGEAIDTTRARSSASASPAGGAATAFAGRVAGRPPVFLSVRARTRGARHRISPSRRP